MNYEQFKNWLKDDRTHIAIICAYIALISGIGVFNQKLAIVLAIMPVLALIVFALSYLSYTTLKGAIQAWKDAKEDKPPLKQELPF